MLGGFFAFHAVIRGGVDTGWTFYTPDSSAYSNSHVVKTAFGIFIARFGSILTGLNFIITIQKMRAPGMTWFRLPLVLWSMYATSIILVLATPVLAITLALLCVERLWGIGIFNPAIGGDQSGPKAGVPYDGKLTKAGGKGNWWEGYDPRMLYTINLLEYSNINHENIGIAATKGIFTRHLAYFKWHATWWALRIMDVIDQYDPDFIYTDGNSTQPFTGDHSGSGFKGNAVPRVVAHYYNHIRQKRGKLEANL